MNFMFFWQGHKIQIFSPPCIISSIYELRCFLVTCEIKNIQVNTWIAQITATNEMNQSDHEPTKLCNPRQLRVTKRGKTYFTVDFQTRKIEQGPLGLIFRFKLAVLRIGGSQARYLFWSFYNLLVSSLRSVLLVVRFTYSNTGMLFFSGNCSLKSRRWMLRHWN